MRYVKSALVTHRRSTIALTVLQVKLKEGKGWTKMTKFDDLDALSDGEWDKVCRLKRLRSHVEKASVGTSIAKQTCT